MYKLVALWSAPKPGDVDAFESYYREVHVPKATVVPGLKRIALTRVDSGLEGAAAPFYRVAEMLFDSPKALEESAHSEVWQAMRDDARQMIERFDVTLTVGMGWVEETERSPARS
jgi:uncharacterized protein (TIGR02118 family)